MQHFLSDLPILLGAIISVDFICLIVIFPWFPWKIYAPRTTTMLKVCTLVTVIFLLIIVFVEFVTIRQSKFLAVAISSFIGIFGAAFMGYWRIPFYIEWRSHKKLFTVVQKYRVHRHIDNPGEVLDPEAFWGAAWMPRLRVDDTAYYVVRYFNNEMLRNYPQTGFLILDEQGKIVRDQALASKIMRCYHFALQVSHPRILWNRYRSYTQLLFSSWYFHYWLSLRWLMRLRTCFWNEELRGDLETCFCYTQFLLKFIRLQQKKFAIEADYSYQKHGSFINECSYDDLLKVAAKIRLENQNFYQYKMEAKNLEYSAKLDLYFFYPMKRKHPSLIKNFLFSSRFIDKSLELNDFFKFPSSRYKSDKLVPIYPFMRKWEERLWQDRLEYVDQTIRPLDSE